MDDLVERVAMHLDRCLCTYVEGGDTRVTDLTGDELRDIARAIIPLVQAHERERCAKVAENPATVLICSTPKHAGRVIAAAIRAGDGR